MVPVWRQLCEHDGGLPGGGALEQCPPEGAEGRRASREGSSCACISWHCPAHGCPICARLAEKKASIGYTYEDSTVAEVEKAAEKPEEEESPAEDESNSDEDEVIPDIGGVPSLPAPSPQPPHIVSVAPHPRATP